MIKNTKHSGYLCSARIMKKKGGLSKRMLALHTICGEKTYIAQLIFFKEISGNYSRQWRYRWNTI